MPISVRSLPWVAVAAGLLTFASFTARPARAAADETCLECHGAETAAATKDDPTLVHTAGWETSVHAQLGLGCADCHTGIDDYPHPEDLAPTSCAECHADAAEDFEKSVHGENRQHNGSASAWPEGNACAVCHGVHDVRAQDDPESPTHPSRVTATCGSCHGNLAIVQAQGLSIRIFENYQQSVHGLERDDPEARPAVCTSCHGAHLVIRANDPASPINPFKIAETCGECHAQEAEQYSSSVHGAAFQRGITTSPICTTCHGIHTIKTVSAHGDDPLSQRLARTTCPACHSSEALMSEYGVAPARVRTYQASYHGLASKRGTTAVADCASCHGVHAIYPSNDERSSVAPANLQTTCGECHPGASEEFSKNPVHFGAGGAHGIEVALIGWIKKIYWGLILVVVGGMLLHNGVILNYYLRRKLRHERAAASAARFTPAQIAQHAVLAITFIALAITGFMLAYPDVWWSRLFESLGLSETWRRWIHRGAAIGLIAASIYHVIWIWSTPYGRTELRRISPRLRDLREVAQNLRFHLGKSDEPARFAKYDYPAKVEYWALVWGTIIMAVTGVILWFPLWATSFMPFWIVKVSEVIHLFEAWLATLAIVFFHFFFVIGHPEVYPLSLAMTHGKMPLDEVETRHPDWHRELVPEPETVDL